MDVALLLVAAAAGLCVVSSQGAGRQYHLIQNQVTWTEAQSYCREKYTDLVTINSMEDMEVLNNMAASSGAGEVWIGLYDDVDSWRWSLTDVTFYKPGEVDFRAWDNGQPNNSKSEQYCVTINDEGRWHDDSCGVLFPAICINETGFVLASTGMTWTKAQSYCRDHHTDLASVRNMEENNEVMNLVPSGQRAWIGLFRESWKWSDGSSLSFTYWAQGEPNNYQGFQENCVITYFHNSGRWGDWPCDRKTAFICYSAPRVSRKVVRVKLKRSSSVDLDDPAVAQKILEQLKQRLKEQGLPGEVKLSWRKKPDGKIFHQEKKETKKKKSSRRKRDEL
ncbi:uncharacterized protein V6R79_009393 [Siganus canaliculatus]